MRWFDRSWKTLVARAFILRTRIEASQRVRIPSLQDVRTRHCRNRFAGVPAAPTGVDIHHKRRVSLDSENRDSDHQEDLHKPAPLRAHQLHSVRDVCLSLGAINARDHFLKSLVGNVTGSPVASVAVLVFVWTQAGAVALSRKSLATNKSIPGGRSAWLLSAFAP